MMLHLKIREVDLFQKIIGQRHHFLFTVPDSISSSDHKKVNNEQDLRISFADSDHKKST